MLLKLIYWLGSTVQICNPEIPRRTSNKFSMQEKVSSIIIPWAEVLSGRDTGIQVWQIADGPCRDLSRDIFRNHRNDESKELYVEYLLPEIVGDPVQVSHLLLLLYKSINQRLKEQNARLTKHKKKNNDNKRNSNLYGDMYNSLLSRIDNKFKSAIKKTFHTFTAYDEPMLTLQDLEDIVEDYKKSLPEHYTAMRRILNFDKKEQETRNMHLTQTNYYKRRLLDIFMSQARIVNSHNLVHYGVVTAGACYGRGVNSKALTHATHAGISTNYRTMMRKVKEYGESMEKTLMDILEYENRIVAVLDNNQKGNCIKFQVDGRSNAFVVVTGRLFKRCNKFELIPGHPQLSNQAEIENRTDLTYVNQKIPSMFYMPIIENISDDTANNIKIIGNIDYATKSDGTIDFSGRRVQRYYEICLKCDVVHNVIRKHFTNYVLHDNKYRPFQHQPIQFITERRKTMTKKLASLKHKTNVFTVFSKWQDKMLDTVDESRNNTSKVFIPGVSLREETTTNGYGMAVVEILELSGIVKKTQTPYDDTPFWKLSDNYKDKILYLSMDGLSLDRHRSFKKKLLRLPQSYSKNYSQGVTFHKALNQVVEITGPLHVAFHMLQSIYDIYKPQMKWFINVVSWKKLKSTRVSECFQLAKRMSMYALAECERYLLDIFYDSSDFDDQLGMNNYVLTGNNSTNDGSTDNTGEDQSDIATPYVFATKYLQFLEDNIESGDNEFRKFLISYTTALSRFRMYWIAIRKGDRMMQERIFIDWLGVFSITNKHNYLDICFNTIEREYASIPYQSLEEIRRNCYVRFNSGLDKDNREFRCTALDEAMEMNNMDVKKLPVRNDKTQWEYHSRNVMFAKKCMLHENQFYRRRHIEYCDDTGELIMKTSDHEEHVKAVAPSAIASKARLYEFIVKMDTSTCNIRNDKEINKIIEHLSTSVTRENTEEEFEDNDDLNNCFNDMFLEREIVEESNNENGDDTETPNHHFHNGTFSNYSFGDIFKQGNDHLKEKNVIEVRKKRNERLHRENEYHNHVHCEVKKLNNNIEKNIQEISNFHRRRHTPFDRQTNYSFRLRYKEEQSI